MTKQREYSTGLRQNQWEKLLLRWTTMEPIGEVKLVVAVIASAIVEEPDDARKHGRRPYRSGFFDGPISAWAALIGLDYRFILEQIDRAIMFNTEDAEKAA